MFYDHRILTQRKYGVATVWLVATIGPKNVLSKKVHKKEILEVNVTKACKTILQSENPLALRLQSNLLFGVTRVFSEQCNYLFTDVTNAHQKISRDHFIQLDTGQIDLSGGRVRPESLLLQDDPAFVPELTFVLPEFRTLPGDRLHHTTQLTLEDQTLLPSEHSLPHLVHGARSSPIAQLIIPDSSSLDGAGLGFQPFFGDDFHGGQVNREEIDDEVDFIFDENGEIRDVPARTSRPDLQYFDGDDERAPRSEGSVGPTNENHWLMVPTGSKRVEREHEDGRQNLDLGNNLMDLDDFQDELFPIRDPDEVDDAEPFPHRQLEPQQERMIISVSHKPKKAARLAQVDDALELGISDIAALGPNYLENMDLARRKRHNMQNVHTAKRVAREWVYGWGGMLRTEPLRIAFEGSNILKLLNPNIDEDILEEEGPTKLRKRTQRSHLDDDGSGSEGSQRGRRVRTERADGQGSRDLSPEVAEIGIGALNFDDRDPGVARRGSLNPDGNVMPWNIPERSSRAGSVISFGGFGTSSVGRVPSSTNRHFSSTVRRKGSPAAIFSRLHGKRTSRVTSSPSIRQNREPISDLDTKGGPKSSTGVVFDENDLPGAEEAFSDDAYEGLFSEENLGLGRIPSTHPLALLAMFTIALQTQIYWQTKIPKTLDGSRKLLREKITIFLSEYPKREGLHFLNFQPAFRPAVDYII
ncbi:hypothetical protein TWF730_004860 [Orbilia blumenaviensis]|uniref:Rad21/Rec8-like protein N-terminal domain-containing protein n=1 Tax=Orbilia blumenaviensis TaxID=1796055 RepID=A0AAV9VGZ2_9PEZI